MQDHVSALLSKAPLLRPSLTSLQISGVSQPQQRHVPSDPQMDTALRFPGTAPLGSLELRLSLLSG